MKVSTTIQNELIGSGHQLPPSTDTGKLQVMHLKRYWAKLIAKRNGQIAHNALDEEWTSDVTLLSTLGLGIEQTVRYAFMENPDFTEFEDWILTVNKGELSQEKINWFNARISGDEVISAPVLQNVLSADDLDFWKENGYIILRNAVSKEDCDKTVELICGHLGISRNDPATWYDHHPDKQGIMIQLFQHPQLQKNRDAEMIRRAYEQLWGRTDILVNTDRVGFNPPETATHKFQGPRLHWDVSLELPIPFGTQGILYLADTAANQGAFTLVPGFQNRVDDWIHSLPPGTNPRTQDIYALGARPIAANAGDFILWHQALPHGSSPNTAALPRFVQYINYQPANPEVKSTWI